MRKRFAALVLAVMMLMSALPFTAGAATTLPSNIYLTQEMSSTCTLSSSAMMLRSRLYLSGNDSWSSVTESGIRSTAWLEGVGLRWDWTYYTGKSWMSVKHKSVTGMTVAELKAVLDAHPEGIVLYCRKVPHAVFLTDYEGDTFYCADPAPNHKDGRKPLAASYPGSKYGTQANTLANVTDYWYISAYSIKATVPDTPTEPTTPSEPTTPETPTEPTEPTGPSGSDCDCSAEYAGTYICTTTTTNLLIRSGHGTSFSYTGYSIPPGAKVTVSRASGNTINDWAHVSYNGVEGYASMQYLKKVEEPKTLPDVTMTEAVGHSTGNIVSWEPVAGASLYQVYRLPSGGTSWTLIKNTGSVSYKDAEAEVGVRYYYKVRARDGEKMSSLNISSVSAVRPASSLPNVTMTEAVGHTTGNLVYWNPVSGANLYQLYRRAASETSWTLIKNTGSTGYKDEMAAVGVRYYYKVVARNGSVKSGLDIAAVSAVRLAPTSLNNVTMTGAQGTSAGNVVSWGAVGGANLYQVYRLRSGESGWQLIGNTTALSYQDTTAETGVRYYYKVIARYGNVKSNLNMDAVSAVRPA